jgi:hypothetical protein
MVDSNARARTRRGAGADASEAAIIARARAGLRA